MQITGTGDSKLWEWLVGGLIVTIQALLVYVFNKHVKEDAETRAMIEQHVKECSETPNAMVLEAIRKIGVTVDMTAAAVTDVRIKVAVLESKAAGRRKQFTGVDK